MDTRFFASVLPSTPGQPSCAASRSTRAAFINCSTLSFVEQVDLTFRTVILKAEWIKLCSQLRIAALKFLPTPGRKYAQDQQNAFGLGDSCTCARRDRLSPVHT